VAGTLARLWLASAAYKPEPSAPERLAGWYHNALAALWAVDGRFEGELETCSASILRSLVFDVPHLPPGVASDVLATLLPFVDGRPDQLDLLVSCALDLAVREGVELDFVDKCLRAGNLPLRTFLRVAVTLMEMTMSSAEIPAVAFTVVRRMTRDDMAEVEREDPHLFHRARQIIRSRGWAYRLSWPE
jgi:hypothetical protein